MNEKWVRWICMGVILAAIPVMAEDKVKVTGDVIRGDTEKKITYIDGNVRIIQGADHITTHKAEINLDEKHLMLEGAVTFDNPDVSVTANFLDYFMKKKTGTFTQDVILKRKESKSKTDTSKKDPFSLFADELFFESKTKNFTAIRGRIEHKDFNGTADRIEYNDSRQEMLFIGNAYLKKPKGEEVWGRITRINLKEKSFEVEDDVIVHFNVEDDKPKPPEVEVKSGEEEPKPEVEVKSGEEEPKPPEAEVKPGEEKPKPKEDSNQK